jgi:hypothetical protein
MSMRVFEALEILESIEDCKRLFSVEKLRGFNLEAGLNESVARKRLLEAIFWRRV